MRKLCVIMMVLAAGVAVTGCVSGPRAPASVNPYRPVLDRMTALQPVKKAESPMMPSRVKVESRTAAPSVLIGQSVTNRVAEVVMETTERMLRKGDRVQVAIYAPPEPFSCPNVVDEDGRINFPLIGPMVVAGKSCGEAQRFVEKAYIDQKIYKTVTVIIVPPEGEYAVAGEVIRPGPYPLTRDQTLLQALARAGRYTEYADKTKIFLTRSNDRVEIKLDDIRQGRRRDIVIIPGDVIEVPRSAW
ncbi:MAG: polysaccharide biosynthesis/export family protein [bacterium]